jgi:hypothetical protein
VLAGPAGETRLALDLTGDRQAVRAESVRRALAMVRDALLRAGDHLGDHGEAPT